MSIKTVVSSEYLLAITVPVDVFILIQSLHTHMRSVAGDHVQVERVLGEQVEGVEEVGGDDQIRVHLLLLSLEDVFSS